MTVFVKIPTLTRQGLLKLAEDLNEKGFDEGAEYYSGGWADSSVLNIASHLKFEDEADAMAFVLAYGGEMCREVPKVNPDRNYYPEDV
jgi:hypothetical protein